MYTNVRKKKTKNRYILLGSEALKLISLKNYKKTDVLLLRFTHTGSDCCVCSVMNGTYRMTQPVCYEQTSLQTE